MNQPHIVPLNLSKLGFRYFRILFESKLFSRKFIEYITNHPNTGFVFEGSGWSGKKRVLGIGIWATSNAEIADIASNIRSLVPLSYKVVYQSELTRLEYLRNVGGERRAMVLIDELEQKSKYSAIELDYLKLVSVDGSLSMFDRASVLNISEANVTEIDGRLKKDKVFYGVFEGGELPSGYTKYFIDTASLSQRDVERCIDLLRNDTNCVYLARGNGKYNLEFEYVLLDAHSFREKYGILLTNCKQVVFDANIYTNLFPQSKSLNTKLVQERFKELARGTTTCFDFTQSELWYINHEGTQGYLDIYDNVTYRDAMKTGEVELFIRLSKNLKNVSAKFNIVDLGSGDGKKGREFTLALGESNIKAYFPVDIQELELAQAVRAHGGATYAIHPTLVGFKNLSSRFPLAPIDHEVTTYCLFGGTYGNFPSNQINTYLSKVLTSEKDRLLVTIQVSDFTDKESLAKTYRGVNMQSMSFGVLRHIGFSLDDFETNPKWPELKIHTRWDNDRLITYFLLKKSKVLHGVSLDAGTQFNVTTSWKPMLVDFHTSLSKAFEIEEMISNRSTAIAICKRK